MSKELADRLETVHTYLANRGVDNLTPIISEAIAAMRSEPVAWSAHGIKREDTCIWMQDSDGPWNTSCGKVFEFTNDGPAENGANFCYSCGGALLPEPYSDAAPSRETDQRTAPAQDSEVMMPVAPSAVHPKPAPWILKPTDDTGMLIPSRETAKVVPVHSKSQYRRVAAQGGNPVLSRETEQRESSGVKGWEFSAGTGSNPAPMHGQSKTGLTESHSGAPTQEADDLLRGLRRKLFRGGITAADWDVIDAYLSRKEQ